MLRSYCRSMVCYATRKSYGTAFIGTQSLCRPMGPTLPQDQYSHIFDSLKKSMKKPLVHSGNDEALDYFSSPNDKVFRNTNAKELNHLWTLLEACAISNDFLRGKKIMENLFHTSNKAEFQIAYAKYLLSWSKSPVSLMELEEYVLKESPILFPTLEFDSKIASILVRKCLTSGSFDNRYQTIITNYIKSSSSNRIEDLFKHLDILGFDNAIVILKAYHLGRESIPSRYRDIFDSKDEAFAIPSLHSTTKESNNSQKCIEEKITAPTYFEDETQLPPSLDKDAQHLIGVDTFGLKVIRHSLLGLQAKPTYSNGELFSKLESFDESYAPIELGDEQLSDRTINFFEIKKLLKTPQQQEDFEKFLDAYNAERQRLLEFQSLDGAKRKWEQTLEDFKESNVVNVPSKSIKNYLWKWHSKLLPLIKEEVLKCQKTLSIIGAGNLNSYKTKLSTMERKAFNERLEYANYLILVSPDKMSTLTILELLKIIFTGKNTTGIRTARAVISVGKAVELEYRSERLLSKEIDVFKNFRNMKNSKEFKRLVTTGSKNTFTKLLQQSRSASIDTELEETLFNWPNEIKAKIGSVLISLLLQSAKIDVQGKDPITNEEVHGQVPAIFHQYQYANGNKIGILKFHHDFTSKLSKDNLSGAVQPQYLPMLVRPKPWLSHNLGGYYYTETSLIRTKDSPEQLAYVKAASENNTIDKVYQGLTVLGNTPWTINSKIFNVISEVWNSGNQFLDIPAIQDSPIYPPQPPSDADPSVIRDWKYQVRKVSNKFSSDRSMRCDANYKLETARGFIGERIYFPHNLDFRGRAYPISPHLNHLGNDMSRGLLLFWEGKELGERGLRWLKIHLANLYGLDKETLDKREQFTDLNKENIIDSATKPLAGKGWWKSSEKPWQTLSVCIELAEAWKLKNPNMFVSHIPVHQDGTCNGLQHYAALGGDVEGATQVNLMPDNKPNDVYSYVAKLVQKRVDIDATNGHQLALKLQRHIKRKVVKQTVMTSVYGVTYIGASDQIDRRLKEIFGDDDPDTHVAGRYLALQVFSSIRELFTGAHEIQDWLAEASKKITKSIRMDIDTSMTKKSSKSAKISHLASVIWTSPLGLPIVQPYRSIGKKQVATNLQTVFISDPHAVSPVDSRKQTNAFPPNYIHSLDASHMLLSSIECGQRRLSFAAVHDSYWTHAADVDIMNEILRDAFVKLHETDLVQDLKDEFDRRYQGFLVVESVSKKSFIGKQIQELRQEFSKRLGRKITTADEIYLEKQRQEYLMSSDPTTRELGEKMVTTVSILENVDLDSLKPINSMDKFSILSPFKLPEIPAKGTFDVRLVKDSTYFFS
ncbi:hypothetical protein LJB42_002394 [Komagataella kurtzmanii]|nr:hypothetical protein LJB42_002394 [Komagataella kurtzmanii]